MPDSTRSTGYTTPLNEQPLTSLRGVGPSLEQKLNRIGLYSVQDLLFHLPLRYQDRTRIQPIGSLQPGEQVPWQSTDLMVNDPGAHQYWVEIVPFLFEDGNEQNNTYGWAFQVAP